MSGPQTPNARPPAGAAGAKAQNKNPISIILPKWAMFCQQALDGTMPEESAKVIRGVLGTQPRAVIFQGFLSYRRNIFDQLPTQLDPRVEQNGVPAVLAMARYEEQKRLAFDDLKTYSARSQAANVASSSVSGTNTPTATTSSPAAQVVAASSPAASSPGTTPQASSQASPRPPPVQNMVRPPQSTTSGRPPVRPLVPKPDDCMSVAEMSRALSFKDLKARAAFLAATPGLAERFQRSIPWYSQNPGAFKAAQGSAVRPAGSSPAPASSGPSTPSTVTAPGAPVSSAAPAQPATTGTALNPALQRTQAAVPAPAPPNNPTQTQNRPPQPTSRPAVRPPQPIRPATPPVDLTPQSAANPPPVQPAIVRPPPPAQPSVMPTQASDSIVETATEPATAAKTPANIDPKLSGPAPQAESTPVSSTAPSTVPVPTPAQPSSIAPPSNNPPAGLKPALSAAPGPSSNQAPPRPFNLNLPPQRLQQPPPPQTQYQAQPQPPPLPPPRPIPIESEVDRRKRKVTEMVAEEAPGLEIEHGVQRILSEYLDAWIDEAAEGAIRLAKHRKSSKVDLKDMALSIDMKHDLRIPGFNVQLPNRTHLPSDADKRRGRGRKAREAEP